MSDPYEPGIFSGLVPSKGFVLGLILVTVLAVGAVAIVAQITAEGEGAPASGSPAEADEGSLAITAPAGDKGSASLAVDGTMLVVQATDLDPSRAAEFYALWLVNSETDLLPLGAFRVDDSGSAKFSVPLPTVLERFRRVEVSREPEDGDPGRSGPIVLSGPTS